MIVISNTIWLWWIIGIYETKSILNSWNKLYMVIILHFFTYNYVYLCSIFLIRIVLYTVFTLWEFPRHGEDFCI